MKAIRTITLNPAFDLHYKMERFEARKENYVQSILCDAGGKGINISRALTVNGVENLAYVILGDENGASFEAQLKRDGLSYVPLYTAGRIRENITLHPDGDRETRISLDTFSVNEQAINALDGYLSKDTETAVLLAFAGRLPRGIEKEVVISFLQKQISKGSKLIVDSNSFTPEDLQRIHPWFIKPNEQEIVAFLGSAPTNAEEAADAAAALVSKGVSEEVMISLGGDGAAWSNGKQRVVLQVPRLEHPMSTIGAGDSTLAGLMAAIANGADKITALSTAVAYGTAACMTAGTLPPRPDDIKTVLASVRATALD